METVSPAAQGVVRTVTWLECQNAALSIVEYLRANPQIQSLYGIPRGGIHAAQLIQMVAMQAGVGVALATSPGPDTLIVDDLIDSGKTLAPWRDAGYEVCALFRKPTSPREIPTGIWIDGWVTFPWEQNDRAGSTGAEDLVVRLLQFIGEDPNRDGLLDTPKRVLKAWKEMTIGYSQDPRAILATTFEQLHDELVISRGIEIWSTCEHHLLPFYGTVDIGYIPGERVVGLSKLARLAECFARRLQIQERLTEQIANAITEHLAPKGVGVVIKARHACMGCRGVMKPDSDMVTSVTKGILRDDSRARAEFLSLLKV